MIFKFHIYIQQRQKKGFTQTALPKNIIDALTKDINKQARGRVVFTSFTGNQLSWIRPDGKMSVYTFQP